MKRFAVLALSLLAACGSQPQMSPEELAAISARLSEENDLPVARAFTEYCGKVRPQTTRFNTKYEYGGTYTEAGMRSNRWKIHAIGAQYAEHETLGLFTLAGGALTPGAPADAPRTLCRIEGKGGIYFMDRFVDAVGFKLAKNPETPGGEFPHIVSSFNTLSVVGYAGPDQKLALVVEYDLKFNRFRADLLMVNEGNASFAERIAAARAAHPDWQPDASSVAAIPPAVAASMPRAKEAVYAYEASVRRGQQRKQDEWDAKKAQWAREDAKQRKKYPSTGQLIAEGLQRQVNEISKTTESARPQTYRPPSSTSYGSGSYDSGSGGGLALESCATGTITAPAGLEIEDLHYDVCEDPDGSKARATMDAAIEWRKNMAANEAKKKALLEERQKRLNAPSTHGSKKCQSDICSTDK